jgi:hypothetical protein
MYTILGYKVENLNKIEFVDVEENKVIVMFNTKASQTFIDGKITYLLRLNNILPYNILMKGTSNLKNLKKITLHFKSENSNRKGAVIEENYEGSGIPKSLVIISK